MTTITTTAPKPGPMSRPRPGPGHHVAPPVPDAFAPWAAMLEQRFPADRYRWVVFEDGGLMPVPLEDEDAAPAGKWQALAARFANLFRR